MPEDEAISAERGSLAGYSFHCCKLMRIAPERGRGFIVSINYSIILVVVEVALAEI